MSKDVVDRSAHRAAMFESALYVILEDMRRMRQALIEIVERESRSQYESLAAAPGEFAQIARRGLGRTT